MKSDRPALATQNKLPNSIRCWPLADKFISTKKHKLLSSWSISYLGSNLVRFLSGAAIATSALCYKFDHESIYKNAEFVVGFLVPQKSRKKCGSFWIHWHHKFTSLESSKSLLWANYYNSQTWVNGMLGGDSLTNHTCGLTTRRLDLSNWSPWKLPRLLQRYVSLPSD